MDDIKQQLSTLPAKPGVYLFKDKKEHILYIGKAKLLHSRVRSYFTANANLDPAKKIMVSKIINIETIICDTENEALVLEANLIQKHQPPYNIILRDDKYYLFIKITTNEELPRVFLVRRIKNDKARYFGPYSSSHSVRSTLRLLRRLFPHKEEKESPREQVFPHPLFTSSTKNAPAYNFNIQNIIHFLQGNRQQIINTLKKGMKQASKEKSFERAAIFRDQIQAIERLEGSQKVYLPRKQSFDCISLASNNNKSATNVFSIRNGKLLNKNTFLLKHTPSDTKQNILKRFILQYYSVAQDIPKTILLPLNLKNSKTISSYIRSTNPPTFFTPKRGIKKQLINMGELNAKQLLDQETIKWKTKHELKKASIELARTLNISSKSFKRIETYDISNIQGKLATGSMVVFNDGQPEKSQYRKFRIKTKNTPDDYLMLQEVLRRRFAKNKHKDWHKPDLIIIDGGKGQLSATNKILNELHLNIPIASLAKKQEELYIPNQKKPIRLPFDSTALYLLQNMRNEAHRFAISYHRLLRNKQHKKSTLDEIPGLGPKTKKKLLNHFGSLKQIRSAPNQKIEQLIGSSKTKTLRNYL
jgi:excinuclease ABC subunit C